jgi:glutaredoxin
MPCPFITTAKRVLEREAVPYHELFIDRDKTYETRVLDWTGFLSVPTLVIAEEGDLLPYEPPAPLAKGTSPRGVNRGSMITEANEEELMAWLRQHNLIQSEQIKRQEV